MVNHVEKDQKVLKACNLKGDVVAYIDQPSPNMKNHAVK